MVDVNQMLHEAADSIDKLCGDPTCRNVISKERIAAGWRLGAPTEYCSKQCRKRAKKHRQRYRQSGK